MNQEVIGVMIIATPHKARKSQTGTLKLSPRLEGLKQKINSNYDENTFHQRKEVYATVFQEYPHEPQQVRTALGLARFLSEKEIPMTEDELLAGYVQKYDYSYTKPADVNVEVEYLLKTRGWEVGHPDRELIEDFQKRCNLGLFERRSPGGHVIAGYHRVLQEGWGKILQTYQTELQNASDEAASTVLSGIIACEAATKYILRYAEKAKYLSETSVSQDYKRQLRTISRSCERICNRKAEHVF